MPSLLRILMICFLGVFQAVAEEQLFEVDGVVRSKLADGRPVIEHKAIPGYMMSMTMVFNVKDTREAAALEVGDQVRFLFRVSETSSVAEQFTVTGKNTSTLLDAMDTPPAKRPLKPGELLPDFDLVNETNVTISNQSLLDRFTVVTFMFTRCPVPEFCPLLATKFSGIQSLILEDTQLSQQVRLLSITLDPEFDSPAVLTVYGQRVGADPALWNFATGKPDEIRKFAQAFAMTSNRSNGLLDHSLTTALIGRNGQVIKLWPGNRWQPEQVLETIRNQEKQAACCSMAPCSGER